MCRAPCKNGHGARCEASGAEQYARSPASCSRGKQRPSAQLVTRQVLRGPAHRPHCCMETGARCRASPLSLTSKGSLWRKLTLRGCAAVCTGPERTPQGATP